MSRGSGWLVDIGHGTVPGQRDGVRVQAAGLRVERGIGE
jgi:hypothetical protein